MKPFMDKDFLLDTPTARHLYHDYCEALPICDYHCHLSPKEIYENAQPTDISALWLSGDHYKWRAMRSCGVDERYCTGDASPREKFQKFAYTLQYAIGNPLYHWAHIELQMYFGIDTPLSAATADDIYDRANAAIAAGDFRPRTLIEKRKVKVLCTTDDPADDLAYHKKIAALPDFDCKVLPTFRPDKALHIQAPDTGFDSVDDGRVARPLSRLLDAMDSTDSLPKTILFNLNDKDNTVLATMLGNFQSTEAASKIQYGPAWWFLDTMDGMTAQLKSLGNLGVLGKFVGMETDSRSFTSYGRHAYFRRILCALIGRWVEQGWYANDDAVLKEIVQGISYNNAIAYFDFA